MSTKEMEELTITSIVLSTKDDVLQLIENLFWEDSGSFFECEIIPVDRCNTGINSSQICM